jgi:hypothetical protein
MDRELVDDHLDRWAARAAQIALTARTPGKDAVNGSRDCLNRCARHG